jgi:hypothetical protein
MIIVMNYLIKNKNSHKKMNTTTLKANTANNKAASNIPISKKTNKTKRLKITTFTTSTTSQKTTKKTVTNTTTENNRNKVLNPLLTQTSPKRV